jgi:hypothetical protein
LRLAVAILAIGAATLLVRAAPLFDAGVDELWGRLKVIRDEALDARGKPDQWRAFTDRASLQLKQIADDARRAHQRQLGPWRWMTGSDRRQELALKEAQRIAESDLPALIAAGQKGNDLRERSVDEALGRLDDHLAGASPYLPPFLPVENQEGLDRTRGVKKTWPEWLIGVIVVDSVLLVVGLGWWLRRSRHRGRLMSPEKGLPDGPAAGHMNQT